MKRYSEEAQNLFDMLTAEEVLRLRKYHPFKVERNEKIRELRRRGASYSAVANICGMSRKAIRLICQSQNRHEAGENHNSVTGDRR